VSFLRLFFARSFVILCVQFLQSSFVGARMSSYRRIILSLAFTLSKRKNERNGSFCSIMLDLLSQPNEKFILDDELPSVRIMYTSLTSTNTAASMLLLY
jgi:hypothetical protein